MVTESLNTSFEVCPAQPSHSGAECDPRHRGADLAWESNQPNAPPLTGFSQEGTDTLTESTDIPAAGPKKRVLMNTSEFSFQLSVFSFQFSVFRFRTRHFISSNHVRVSTFYHIDAVILSSTELKDGH